MKPLALCLLLLFLLPAHGFCQGTKKNTSDSYKTRVEGFWKWYEKRAEYFYKQLDEGNALKISDEVVANVEKYLPGMAWVFGPGAEDKGHSFTLTAEGDEDSQKLTEYWLNRAPKLEGWTFYDARQPGNVEDITIRYDQQKFAAKETLIKVSPDKENLSFDMEFWHPGFAKIERNHKFSLTFLWLDEALGEKGTGNWLGRLTFPKEKPEPSETTISIGALKDFIENHTKTNDWKQKLGNWSIYQLKPDKEKKTLRSDVYLGVTSTFTPLNDYFEKMAPAGKKKDPFLELGAHYLFVTIDLRNQPESIESPLEFRNSIADSFEEALIEAHAGEMIGGATGVNHVYIDLIIYDKKLAVPIIKKIIKAKGWQQPSSIQPFYKSFGKPIEF